MGQVSKTGDSEMIFSVTTRETHQLQPEVFGQRTWRHDLQIFHFKPEWKRTLVFYKEAFQSLCLANIVWILLLNGTFLGIYVYQASTFATILMSPPYTFKSGWLGYVQLVQVLDSVIMVPILGYGSDLVARSMSTRRNGLFQVCRQSTPEKRVISKGGRERACEANIETIAARVPSDNPEPPNSLGSLGLCPLWPSWSPP